MRKRIEALLGRLFTLAAHARAWRCTSCLSVFKPFDTTGIWQVPDGRCCFCAQWERAPGSVAAPAVPVAAVAAGEETPRMGDAPTVITSPYSLSFPDNYSSSIGITVVFNNTTRAITGCTVFRDADCQWTRIYVGLGPDGTVETSPQVFSVPAGTTTITPTQLAARGVTVIEDIVSVQITAGP